ncbi:MAG: FecR domain-containing protein, partial [Spirochaetia bacterium]|nr:FecR domain-containing protein [Spirochaetia bacterium]
MNRFGIAVGAALLFALVACRGKTEERANEQKTARLTMINGSVHVLNNGTERAINLGDYLLPGDTLKTEKTATAEIFVKGQGLMKVSENSEIQMGAILAQGQTSVEVRAGSAAMFLKKQDRQGEFTVKSPTAVAGVRGTSFLVTVDDKSTTRFALVEGAIELKNAKGSMIMDKAGEVTVTNDTDLAKIAVRPLSPAALESLKKLAVFQRSNLMEYNSLVDDLKQNEAVKGLEVQGGSATERFVKLADDSRRPEEAGQKAKR